MIFTKKSVVKIHLEGRDFESTTTTAKLNDAELLNYLKQSFDKYGELVITNIVDNEIRITTNKSIEHNEVIVKVNRIKEMIYDFISE